VGGGGDLGCWYQNTDREGKKIVVWEGSVTLIALHKKKKKILERKWGVRRHLGCQKSGLSTSCLPETTVVLQKRGSIKTINAQDTTSVARTSTENRMAKTGYWCRKHEQRRSAGKGHDTIRPGRRYGIFWKQASEVGGIENKHKAILSNAKKESYAHLGFPRRQETGHFGVVNNGQGEVAVGKSERDRGEKWVVKTIHWEVCVNPSFLLHWESAVEGEKGGLQAAN